jgi:hypothetical protein
LDSEKIGVSLLVANFQEMAQILSCQSYLGKRMFNLKGNELMPFCIGCRQARSRNPGSSFLRKRSRHPTRNHTPELFWGNLRETSTTSSCGCVCRQALWFLVFSSPTNWNGCTFAWLVDNVPSCPFFAAPSVQLRRANFRQQHSVSSQDASVDRRCIVRLKTNKVEEE